MCRSITRRTRASSSRNSEIARRNSRRRSNACAGLHVRRTFRRGATNPFTFQTTPNVLFEAGAAKKIAGLVSEFGARRVLFVTDKGVRGAGLTREAEASLAAGCDLTVFEDVVADPPADVVETAVALCRDQRIDAVVSIGGGSALDTAKLVAYLARSGDRLDDIYGVGLAKG